MKSKSLFTAGMVLLVPSLAFAGPKKSANVELDQSVEVAGIQLAPGDYKLIWDGTGPDITVSFADGKKTVATVPAELVTNRNDQEAIETDNVAGDTTVLRAIDLKNNTIRFENAAPSAAHKPAPTASVNPSQSRNSFIPLRGLPNQNSALPKVSTLDSPAPQVQSPAQERSN
jgi:hypothetical protein